MGRHRVKCDSYYYIYGVYQTLRAFADFWRCALDATIAMLSPSSNIVAHCKQHPSPLQASAYPSMLNPWERFVWGMQYSVE